MMLLLGMATPAFAKGAPIIGTEAEPAQAAATKMLVMPIGTTTPTATFTFDFAKKSMDESTAPAALAEMPAITSKSVSFTAADVGTTVGGIKSVPKETASIFVGVTWPHAGLYEYTVTERTDTFTSTSQNSMTFTDAVYDLKVYVDNGTNGLYIYAIAAVIVVTDPFNEDDNVGDKVDPTPGGDPTIDGDFSKMVFTNNFLRNNGPETVLAISKTITGTGADRSKYFPFSVTVTNPATVNDPAKTYKAFVVQGTTTLQTITANAPAGNIISGDDPRGPYIRFTTGVPLTVNLTDGQHLAFTDLPVGASFTATDQAAVDFTPSYRLTLNAVQGSVVAGAENSALSTGSHYITESYPDRADFNNTYKTIAVTGIFVDDLPYYAIIGVALLTLAGFVLFKSRRRRLEE